MNRIGMFGGTFDPPHIAHLIAASIAVEEYALDLLVFVPAYIPPHKQHTPRASASDRYEMTKLATQGNPRFAVSGIEIERKGLSYSIDTILHLKQQYSCTNFFLIIGADNLVIFDSWYQADRIRNEATVVALSRPDHTVESNKFENVLRLNIPLMEISSTMVRSRIAEGKQIDYLVPNNVRDYIRTNQLYSSDTQ